jgi:hypothetical protein
MKINRNRVVNYRAVVYGRLEGIEDTWLGCTDECKYRWLALLGAFFISARYRFAGIKVYVNASTAEQVAAKSIWQHLVARFEFDRADALEDKYLRHAWVCLYAM